MSTVKNDYCGLRPRSLLARWQAVWLVSLVAMMVAGIVRWTVAGDELWLDELHTAWACKENLADVFSRAAAGNQTPLFFWLTWGGLRAFGKSALALRSVSLLCGVFLVAMAGAWVWRASRSVAGVVLTVVIVALDWRFVFYATEARPYALMQLLGAVQAYLFADLARLFESERPRQSRVIWVGWVLVSIAMIYTHVTSVWLLAAETLLVALIWCSQALRGRGPLTADLPWRAILMAVATIILAMIPLAVGFGQTFERRSNWSDLSSFTAVWTGLWIPLTVWIGLPLAMVLVDGVLKRWTGDAKPRSLSFWLIGFVMLWALTPIMSVFVVDAFGIAPLALVRYTLIGYVAMAIFSGLGVSRLRSGGVKIAAAVTVLGLAHQGNFLTQQLVRQGTLPHLRNESWSVPVAQINADQAKRDQPVYVFANVIEDVDSFAIESAEFQDYLLFPVSGLDAVDRSGRIVQACPTAGAPHFRPDHFPLIAEQGGAWLLVRGRHETVNSVVDELRTGLENKVPDREVTVRFFGREGSDVYAVSVDLR